MKKILAIAFLFLWVSSPVNSQQKTPKLNGWRVHLPYWQNKTVCVLGDKIYCGSASGIFTYNSSDKSVERISKVNGMSDVEVSLLRSYPEKNIVFVIYENANMDIIQNNEIFNIADIKLKTIIGKKTINNVSFFENKAYLSCSFGIVIVDLERKQIVDSYDKLGFAGAQVEFFDITIYNDYIYASGNDGLYRTKRMLVFNDNLGYYDKWQKESTFTSSRQSEIFRGKMYVVADSIIKIFDGFAWSNYAQTSSKKTIDIQQSSGKLIITLEDDIITENADGTSSKLGINYKNACSYLANGRYAMVDNFYGLTLYPGGDFGGYDYIFPNGPYAKTAAKMLYNNSSLWVGGGMAPSWLEGYSQSGVYNFSNNVWQNSKQKNFNLPDTILDYVDAAVSPINGDIFFSTYGSGLVQLNRDGKYLTNYNNKNSSLQNYAGGDKSLRTAGIVFDAKNNLWITNHSAVNPISVFTYNNQWKSFSVGNLFSGQNYLSRMIIDDLQRLWIAHTRDGGILVYNFGNPNDVTLDGDDSYKVLTKDEGNGGLASNQVNCFVNDKRGEIWIGTNNGLCIISNPSLLFDNPENINFDAHQIVIKTNLVYSNFLGGENINCIKLDGANRKWIGTSNGVWLVSEDGYTVIKNFTFQNSPLLDNNVTEIGIDDESGEVFFATDKGIISYMGDATEGENNFKDVRIYPNPVRPNFTGDISIRGLPNNVNVKVTDISGNLVYETTSNGGFATWNGKNFLGQRVATGVYMIMCAVKSGEKSFIGKILFVN